MQISGRRCKVCDRKIVFSQDGKFCSHCGIVLHQACDSKSNCTICGDTFRFDELPGIDPIHEAVLPRTLRNENDSLAIAVVVSVAAGIIVIMYHVMMAAISNGH